MPNNEGMRCQPPPEEVGRAKSLSLNSSLGPGSASGEKGKKSAGEARLEAAQATAGLASLANMFPIWPRFLLFSPLQSLVPG